MSMPYGQILCCWLLFLFGVGPATVRPLAAQEKKPRTDRYGDALPEGAITRLGTVGFRHASQVTSVAYSADGKLMATTGYDETVRLWEMPSGKERFRFRLAGKRNYHGPGLAFTPDGKMLAAANGSGAGALCVWDTTTGKERLKRDLSMQDGTSDLAFAANGKTLAILSFLSKFDPRTGNRWTEHRIRLWDAEKGAEVASFQPPEGATVAIAFSPDGKMLAVAQEDGLHVCEPDTGKKLRTLSNEKTFYRRIAFSADGTLATNGKDAKTIQLWDAATGRPKQLLRGHEKDVCCLAFSADGKRLVSSSVWDNSFRVWDVASGDTLLVHRAPAVAGVGCVALSPDGKTVAEGSVNSVFVLGLWDVATGKEAVGPQGQNSAVEVAGFDSAGKVLTAGRVGGSTVHIWDPEDGKRLSVVRDEDDVGLVGLSSDGKTIAFGRRGGTVCLRDADTGKEKLRLEMEAFSVQSFAFAPDGKTLAVGYLKINKGYHCSLVVWDLTSGKKLRQFPTPGSSVESATFSPDGKKLVSISSGMRIWDPANGDELGQFPTKGIGVSGWGVVRFSPDGELVAGPSYPKGFGVWKSATRELVGRFDSDGVTVRSVTFSTDNKLLACGKEDGVVELWDVKTWKVVGKGQGPRGRVYVLAFSKDDRRLVSGHENTTALVWDVPKLLAPAREKIEK